MSIEWLNNKLNLLLDLYYCNSSILIIKKSYQMLSVYDLKIKTE